MYVFNCLYLCSKKRGMKDLMFTKMHGAGNDYIFINCLDAEPENLGTLSCRLSERHKGIGADGLVAVLPSKVADFKMRMFNADGSEGKMCGNASRCLGKYVYEKRLTDKKNIALETLSGVKNLKLFTDFADIVDAVTVDMGEPILDPAEIPVKSVDNKNFNISVKNTDYTITAVSIGNPHGVIFCSSPYLIDLPIVGKIIGEDSIFPDGVNVEFVNVLNKRELEMRVWERGSGETLACGTGACAAVVAGVVNGLCEKTATVHLPGGDLEIAWLEDNHVYMTGPAEISFEGIVRIN